MLDPKISSPKLVELAARRAALSSEMNSVDVLIREEKLRLIDEVYGVAAGSVVRCSSGIHKGKFFRVVSIDLRWGNRPNLEVNPLKKDGTFGVALQTLYGDWDVVPDPTQAAGTNTPQPGLR